MADDTNGVVTLTDYISLSCVQHEVTLSRTRQQQIEEMNREHDFTVFLQAIEMQICLSTTDWQWVRRNAHG